MAVTMKRRTQFTLYTAANGQRVASSNNIDCAQEFTESPLELPVDCHLDDSLPGLLYRHQQVSPHSPGKRVPGIASINLLSENLPTDMSDTTDSDADKHGGHFTLASAVSTVTTDKMNVHKRADSHHSQTSADSFDAY
uniref:Uncharacterized protein n=1 Tax=Timema poppense TaxID=170557 RepID=A0A7R9D9A8_TIMPO|nr:unnamed protein product [Timema poppensis]